jgi:hypothetical protein
VKFGDLTSEIKEIYDNHDVYNIDNLYWEIENEEKKNDISDEKPIIPLKKVFYRNVNNKRRRIIR